jgi:cyclohexa-1,5-dienecarbonyl-CoA hydratase
MPIDVAFNPDRTRAALRISHPKGNIITAEIVSALRSALDDLVDERALRLVTLEGEGADFSFGASVPEHAPGEIDRVLPEMHALIMELLVCPAPTAAVVRGRCLGGGFELALACDFIFASDAAVFGLPEIALGVFPPAASVLLPMRVGTARATSAVLTGATRSAGAWHRDGLIERIAPDASLAASVDDWFDVSLGRWSAEALRHAVHAVRVQAVDAATAWLPEVERIYLQELMSSSDAREGIQAFLEKRAPVWRDE